MQIDLTVDSGFCSEQCTHQPVHAEHASATIKLLPAALERPIMCEYATPPDKQTGEQIQMARLTRTCWRLPPAAAATRRVAMAMLTKRSAPPTGPLPGVATAPG